MSRPSKLNIALGFAAIYIIWGSTYLAIRFGVEDIPPFLMAGVRFIIGGGLFYLVARLSGTGGGTGQQWLHSGIIGLLLVVGGNGLVTWSEETVPSGLTSLLVAVVPLWIVLMDWLRPGGVKPRLRVIGGLVLGFIGVALLINPTGIGNVSEIDIFGAMLVITATLLWSFGSIYSRHAVQPKSKFLGASMQMITGGVMLILLSLARGETSGFEWQAVSIKSILALIYLITFGSLGFFAYIWLLKWSTPARVATYAYVNPVIALFLGNWLANEPLTLWTIGCSLVILTAVIIIVSTRKTGFGVKTKTNVITPASTAKAVAE